MVSIPESIYSFHVNFHTNPSHNPTRTLSSQLGHNVWFDQFPVSSPPPPVSFFFHGFVVKLHRFHCFLQLDSRTYKHVTMLNMQTNTRRICWSRTSLTCAINFRVMKDSYFLQRRREKRLNKLLARPQSGWTMRAGTRLLT